MIVVIVENPEPNNPLRVGTDIEVRIMFRGSTGDEGSAIGAAIRALVEEIRPGVQPTSFLLDAEKVVMA